MKFENGGSSRRNTNWQLIGYPESLDLFWKDLIQQDTKNWYISPLHDKDIFVKDEVHKEGDVTITHKAGEKKKAHYHVLVQFDSLKSWEQVKEWADSIGFAMIQSVMSWCGSLRYLCHLDGGKGKETYNVQDVECCNDDYLTAINVASDKDVITKEIITLIKTDAIADFSELVGRALEGGSDWVAEVRKYAYFYRSLCESISYRRVSSKFGSAKQKAFQALNGIDDDKMGVVKQDAVSMRDEYDKLPF